ncbi:SIMPL domain-containing protein [Clostridium fungisolvens]|uniref:26 kDa periplasmic immunogenic protein n=1 Tax=Clostridium fungisolvens TaxID=1604897 RepID=A0A6V8SKJ8_9CLOT|nr:SIMPL domain-containing protein [Clostridium fungisolvens]GFP75668.1 26 kDa periplasmic immunogenic protein [Clostridium fungisolvens]
MYPDGYGNAFSSRYNYLKGFDGNEVFNNVLKVIGNGTIKAKPDIAEITLGVITENESLKTAQKENAEITVAVLDALKNNGVATKDIQTESYTINTKYDYVDGKQVFKGYEVRNSLRVTIREISRVGITIDSAVESGVNNVGNISFTIQNPSKYYSEALRLAVEDAQKKAVVITSKLNVKIYEVPIRVVELTNENQGPRPMGFKTSIAATTPIEAGENAVSASVEAVFLYAE